MKLKELLASKKVKTGLEVEFSEAKGKNGKVILVIAGDEKFILQASIDNYQRFMKWVGEKSIADIRRTGKFYKTEYGYLPTIEIRTTVKVDDDGTVHRDNDYSDWIF